MATVSALFIYPVKSLAGIALREVDAEERGLHWDRRWMIVDESNNFISQRTVPKMATIRTAVTQDGILTLFAGENTIVIPACDNNNPREDVTVWSSIVPAIRVSKTVDAFLSGYLGFACSLVYMPDDTRRMIEDGYGNSILSFADGDPILLANTASLEDLNGRMDQAIPMDRFRPNIVVETSSPFMEDTIGIFKLGEAILDGVKPCARCSITTIDQITGERTGKEPLKTLASFRRGSEGVNFGENLIVKKPGIIRIGDTIEILEPRGIYPRPVGAGSTLSSSETHG